ncbi:Ig-like domain-containing protein, partial [Pseudomonas sp. F1_0610]|uniref:Ig-like domain-containing protein n=2 Tax=Pseudomonas sp. F1_0610 TaxID=3114284 RepID=UPI0039C4B85D
MKSLYIGVITDSNRNAKILTGKDGKTLRLKAQANVEYILVNPETGYAPDEIITLRDGNDLKIFFLDEEEPSIIITDYYLYPSQVVGQLESGDIVGYTPVSTLDTEAIEALVDKANAVQVLNGELQEPVVWVADNDINWGLLVFLGLVAGGAAGGGGGGGGHDEGEIIPPPTQKTTITEVEDDLEPVVGIVANDGVTNDNTPTIKGILDAPLASGQEVVIYRNGQVVGKATVTGTTWTFEDSLAGDGKYTYTAGVKDAAGNAGALSNEYHITLDTASPDQVATIDQIIDDVDPIQGDIGNNGTTNDKTPTLKGSLDKTLDSTEQLVIYRDGKKVGIATVSNTQWEFTDSIANDGNYTYVARVEDAAGNQGVESNEYQITLDTAAPSQTV